MHCGGPKGRPGRIYRRQWSPRRTRRRQPGNRRIGSPSAGPTTSWSGCPIRRWYERIERWPLAFATVRTRASWRWKVLRTTRGWLVPIWCQRCVPTCYAGPADTTRRSLGTGRRWNSTALNPGGYFSVGE